MTSLSRMRRMIIVDPAVRVAEADCFNQLVQLANRPCSYHLPCLAGTDSLKRELSDIEQIAGVIILGSGQSVVETVAWQSDLVTWLETMIAHDVPVLGICYGHQLVAHMYGCEVGFVTADQHKLTGFQEVHILEGAGLEGVDKSGLSLVSHAEEVKSLTPAWQHLASRQECLYEGIRHKEKPIWGFQSHIEATPAFVKNQSIELEKIATEQDFHFGRSVLAAFFTHIDQRGH